MNVITDRLIVRRAEHHEGDLMRMEEVSFHQQHLSRIGHRLSIVCPRLKILFLQDNYIERIEGLQRMRELEHINMTLNNIQVVTGLEACDSLERLDLTLNFVHRLTESCAHLRAFCPRLRQLNLVGNPCASYEWYRQFTIDQLPHLDQLDNKNVTRTERTQACRDIISYDVRKVIKRQETSYAEQREIESRQSEAEINEMRKKYDDPTVDISVRRERFFTTQMRQTIEHRREMGRKLYEFHLHDEDVEKQRFHCESHFDVVEDRLARKRTSASDRRGNNGTSSVHTDGLIDRHSMTDVAKNPTVKANDADWTFDYRDEKTSNMVLFTLHVYKHVDTEEIEVDVKSDTIRVVLRRNVFEIELPVKIDPAGSSAQRSATTGHLLLSCPKV